MNSLYRLVILVSLSSTGATASRFAVLVCAAQIGASHATVGLLAGLFSGLGVFTAVPTGRLVDRIGTRKPLLWSAIVLALAVAAGIVSRDLPVLFAIVCIGGLAHNVMIVTFQKLAGDLAPANARAEAFGMLSFGFSISILAAPVVAGFAIDYLGFVATFALFTLVPLASFALAWFNFLPWPPVAEANVRADSPQENSSLAMLRDPVLFRIWVSCVMFESAWMGFGFMLPILGTDLGYSASTIGMIAGTAGFTLFIARAILTPLLRWLTPWQLLLAGMASYGIGIAGMVIANAPITMALCGAFMGLGQGVASPMTNALIYENAREHQKGEALAMRALISNAAQGGMPLVSGPLSGLVGIPAVFALIAAGLFGSVWLSRHEWTGARTGRSA